LAESPIIHVLPFVAIDEVPLPVPPVMFMPDGVELRQLVKAYHTLPFVEKKHILFRLASPHKVIILNDVILPDIPDTESDDHNLFARIPF
jgi:hypothetical protein